ncbi:MAG: glycosyltransferase family 2 protein [Dissulfurispiraceae bacterium]
MNIECLNQEHSTTRRVTRETPVLCVQPEAKFERMLFLQANPQRTGEGGLRTNGYFKAGTCTAAETDTIARNVVARQNPLITVITVVFNGAETLEQTILSVLRQSSDNVEYLIIDGGSTDGTLDIIRKYEYAIDYWVSEPDGGIYEAWNKAAGIALGDWCIFLGADDELASDNVLEEIFLSYAPHFEEYQLIYGKLHIINSATGELLEELGQPREELSREYEFFRPKLPKCPEILMHRSLFSGNATFDTTYRIAGDAKFLLHSLASGARVLYLDLPVAKMRLGGVSSAPKNLLIASRETRRMCRELGIKIPLSHFAKEWVKLVIKIGLSHILPERIYFSCVNVFRFLTGRAPIWNRS